MLHDFDKTLENLLLREGNLNPSEIDISFESPTGEWSSRLSRPTINLWCFDLRENLRLRPSTPTNVPGLAERQASVMNGNSRITVNNTTKRMDINYLVTAWARKPEDEHQLLWRALAVLKRFPHLDPDKCEGALRYQNFYIPLIVADMGITATSSINFVDLWSVLDNQMRLGFILSSTLELDLHMALDVPLVLEGIFRVGEAENPPDNKLTHLADEVRIKPKPGQTPEKKVLAKKGKGEGS